MSRLISIISAMVLTLALIVMGCAAPAEKEVTVGNKNFTEEYVVGELMKQLLEDRGFKVNLVSDLSSAALRGGMETGDIDICADYTGTAWMVYLEHEYEPTGHNELYNLVKEEDEGNGFIWLNPMWNHNSYALVSWSEYAEEHNLETMSDLAAWYNQNDGDVSTFIDFEYSTRPDGLPALEEFYGFQIAEDALMTGLPGASLLALGNHQVDVAMAFATDPQIARHAWRVYTDDKSFYPPYDLTPYVRAEVLSTYPEIEGIINELVATFPGGGATATPEIVSECQTAWQELNGKVDIDKMEPDEVAHAYLIAHGLITG